MARIVEKETCDRYKGSPSALTVESGIVYLDPRAFKGFRDPLFRDYKDWVRALDRYE